MALGGLEAQLIAPLGSHVDASGCFAALFCGQKWLLLLWLVSVRGFAAGGLAVDPRAPVLLVQDAPLGFCAVPADWVALGLAAALCCGSVRAGFVAGQLRLLLLTALSVLACPAPAPLVTGTTALSFGSAPQLSR